MLPAKPESHKSSRHVSSRRCLNFCFKRNCTGHQERRSKTQVHGLYMVSHARRHANRMRRKLCVTASRDADAASSPTLAQAPPGPLTARTATMHAKMHIVLLFIAADSSSTSWSPAHQAIDPADSLNFRTHIRCSRPYSRPAC